MAPQDTHPDRAPAPPEAPTDTKVKGARGILEGQQERRAARKRRRLVSARNRRSLARSLRATASQTHGPGRTGRHLLPLHYRAVAVRTELLEIAAALERAHDPDPAYITLLLELLADPDSPLYNPRIPADELDRALRRVRAGLAIQPHV